MTNPAEAMRELAAQAIESDKFDPTVRMDFDKHKGLPDWFNAQRAAYIRSIPLPDDPRDAEIEKLRAALQEIAGQRLFTELSVDEQSSGDFYSAYDEFISIARVALEIYND